MKNRGFKIIATGIILFFLFGIPGKGQIILAEWNFPNNPDDLQTDAGTPLNLDRNISLSGDRPIVYYYGFTTSSAAGNGWDNGTDSKYWQISLNTVGYSTLFLSSKQRSSNTGPGNFKIEYSIDNGFTWYEAAPITIVVKDDWTSGITNIILPRECNNQPELWIRWVMTSNMSVGGEAVSNMGTSRIDDVVIKGCNIFINSFEPMTGPAGTRITIRGLNFTDATDVRINDISTSFTVINPTTIAAVVPLLTASGLITVSNAVCSGMSTSPYQLINTCPENGSNLIISELCDPFYDYGTTRYIEIFNPTNNIISLEGWRVEAISNRNPCFTWNLTGSINPNQALTCGSDNPLYGGPHTFTDPAWNSVYPCCMSWNGEKQDGAILYNGATIIDYVYFSPNNSDWFRDGILSRNSDICNPSISTNLSEWTFNSVTYAGTLPSTPRVHNIKCFSLRPSILIQPKNQSGCIDETFFISVKADGILPLTFQWKFYNSSAGDWVEISGSNFYVTNTENSSTLKIINLPDELQLYCEVKNYGGDCYQASNSATVVIMDKDPPSLLPQQTVSICVEKIKTAIFNAATSVIDPEPPDHYSFIGGNQIFDIDPLTFSDNCKTQCVFEIRWRITFSNGATLPVNPEEYFSGQPSAFSGEIKFPGDRECVNDVNHTITYQIIDCAGNISPPVERAVTITPRPVLVSD